MSIIARNSQARFDYYIDETFMAGLVLQSTEVKSIRAGRVNIKGAYCNFRGGELWLIGASIPHYNNAVDNHDVDADRKLLLTKSQLRQLTAKRQQGYQILPLAVLKKGNFIKLEIGIGKPKKLHDKRDVLRRKDDERRQKAEIARKMKR